MKASRIPILLFLNVFILSCRYESTNEASSTGKHENDKSQIEINLSAEEEYKNARLKLDNIITSIKTDYNRDTSFINSLTYSQKKWIEYRDAQILLKYSMSDPIRDGSAFNTCYYQYLEELTLDRISALEPWVKKAEEGNICSGSVKIREE